MLLLGSYANGFAPRDGRPLYESLWKGCVGAWNPGLGVSGLTLRDQSGFNRHGVLTNGATWAASQGKYALDFDGTDDCLQCGTQINASLLGEITVAGSFKFRNRSTVNAPLSNLSSGGATGLALEIGRTANKLSWLQNGASVDATSTGTITDANIHHVAVVRTGSTGAWTITFYIDGISSSHSTAANPSAASLNGQFTIARYGDYTGGFNANMQATDLMVFSRALSPQEIRTLASRRGIAYEMAPRRRSSVQVTTNRRRRIIIGGNR